MSYQLLLRRLMMEGAKKDDDYLRLISQDDGCSVTLNKVGTPYDVQLEYSVNTSDFVSYTIGDTISLDRGEYVRFRRSASDATTGFCKNDTNYYQFSITGTVVGCGMLSCLKKTDGLVTTLVTNDFDKLFASRIYFNDYALPYTLTTINKNATTNVPITCKDLVIPSGITRLVGSCFVTIWWQYLYLPSSVTFIDRYNFANSTTPVAVYYGGTLEQWLNITYNNPTFDGGNPLILAHNLYIDGQLVTSVTIPQEMTQVKNAVLWGGTCVTSVTLHNNITSIGINSFDNCSLTSILLPSGLTSIGTGAFRNNNLSSVTIPSSVTSIGQNAFSGNPSLQEVYYSGTQSDWESIVTSSVFNKSYSLYLNNQPLTSVVLSNTSGYSYQYVSTITSMDSGTATKIGGYKFYHCTNLSSVNIREGVTEIGSTCFGGCGSLTSFTIPSTVTTMGIRIFQGCSSLVELVALPTTPPSLGLQSFDGTNRNLKIYVPYSADHSILNAYKTASNWSAMASKMYELNPDGTIPS